MPDHFFNLLDMTRSLDEQIAFVIGKYIENAMIKSYIEIRDGSEAEQK